MNSENHELKSD